MRIITIVGARPQFIKAAPVSQALRRSGHEELILHTGQHFDHAMAGNFFDELDFFPDFDLGVKASTHAVQTAEMLAGIEALLTERRPDWVLVYGDTNSTLAGGLAAAKLDLSVAHVEAGLRSFNRTMPEEINRILVDHLSSLLFCPTEGALRQLSREGLGECAHLVGDTMADAVRIYGAQAEDTSRILDRLGLKRRSYLLATLHRPYNVDDPVVLARLIDALDDLGETVVFPLHPRTRQRLPEHRAIRNIRFIEPVGFLDMLKLEANARIILTDSGGVQKEAYFVAVPCITLRPETEWRETVETGWNRVVGSDPLAIAKSVHADDWPLGKPPVRFGSGHSADKIVSLLEGAHP